MLSGEQDVPSLGESAALFHKIHVVDDLIYLFFLAFVKIRRVNPYFLPLMIAQFFEILFFEGINMGNGRRR